MRRHPVVWFPSFLVVRTGQHESLPHSRREVGDGCVMINRPHEVFDGEMPFVHRASQRVERD